MDSVELHHAYLWVCNSCGKENVSVAEKVYPKSLEFVDDDGSWELEEVGEEEDMEKSLYYREFDAVFVYPGTVTCKYCKTEFKTEFN